ncbi:MAG TPA: rhodanese-like domain-containing protein, partial [bacterium]|nr:rhodanese-like domain-containing protein [bacterium]
MLAYSRELFGKTNEIKIKRIKSREMLKIINAIDKTPKLKEKINIIDVRNYLEYENERLPYSLCIPCKNSKKILEDKVNDKKKRLIFYCSTQYCPDAEMVSQIALDAGYFDVSIYSEGFAGWKKNNCRIEKGIIGKLEKEPAINSIKPGDLNKILDKVFLVNLIDDTEIGTIPNCISMPINEFYFRYNELPRDKEIVLYYLNSKNAVLAVKYLLVKGFDVSNIRYLEGGIINWRNCG